jgi:3-methyladenine DNA glycosylase/8-oxoguanine DNA glycosylase
MAGRSIALPLPVDLGAALGPLCRGRGDPAMRVTGNGVWRATRTPEGAATVHLAGGDRTVRVQVWGPGRGWALEHAAELLGAADDLSGFAPRHPLVAALHRQQPGLRIVRSRAVFEAMVPTIIEQKVVGLDARRAYRRLLLALGSPAPGPGRGTLLVPPGPQQLASLPYEAFHPFGIERKRADTIRRAAAGAAGLEAAGDLPPEAARSRLRTVRGVGAWTAAEVAMIALGDADAVSVGDYHLPHQVAWALAGERRATDDRMLELLAPFAGHRGRVARLIAAAGLGPPRRAPRMPTRSIAWH